MSQDLHPTQATQFHERVGGWLETLGFALISDTQQRLTQYGVSQATYQSDGELYFRASFNPLDGNSASLSIGRYWLCDEGWAELSNQYYVVADALGFSLPKYYSIGDGSEVQTCIESIWSDLQQSMPSILQDITAELLASVEDMQFGAKKIAVERLGQDYAEHMRISEFLET